MPVIAEEQENLINDADADLAPLLNTSGLAFTGANDETPLDTAFGEEGRPYLALCPLHPDSADCTCSGFVDDWEFPEAQVDPLADLEEPDYSKFENWIPRFFRPEKPCDYCRSRRLDCYLQRGEPHCTPCASLFRECSLTNSNTLEATNYIEHPAGMFLDTLHVVDEDAAIEKGTFTGVKPLKSKVGNSGTSTPVRGDDAPGSTKRNGIRFPRHAVKTLRDWLDGHIDHPYPTEDEKVELEKLTELKPIQIANWLANARRRKKVAQKSKPKTIRSPSLRPTTPAMPIPGADEKPWEELNPLERWKNSPPENDPASILDIANAVANSDLPDDEVSSSPSSMGRRGKGSSSGSALSNLRAPSTTSQETGKTSSLSASSIAFSHNSSVSTHGSFGSFSSSLVGKKDRRRRRRPAPPSVARKSVEDRKRIFQCTFCTDTFKAKYDWTRHEKSLHLSLEKWICVPQGPIVTDRDSNQPKCAYCDLHNPSTDHLESHNHKQCEDKGLESRTFFRKDHLRQHLRLMHGCEMSKSMDDWKSTAWKINSRCGFCSQRFTMWQDRIDHLTAHFKAGSRMSEWKGCRGLDPAVAAQVTNAMPPYLIGIESVSPNPFSATNRATWRESGPQSGESNSGDCEGFCHKDPHNSTASIFAASGSEATCFEVLTVRLGQYAKKMAAEGMVMTDDMLQTQARRILYDSDDTWNQTAADNPEWLDLFKKAHGLDFIPNALGGQGLHVPADLETYGDLGLRIPFAVQLQALNRQNGAKLAGKEADLADSHQETIEQQRRELQDMYADLAKDGVLYSDGQRCEHASCATNVIDFSSVDGASATGYSPKRWCSHQVSPERAHQMTAVAARAELSAKVIGAAITAQQQEIVKRGVQALWDLHDQMTLPDSEQVEQNASPVSGEAQVPGVESDRQAQQQAAYHSANARARSLAALARAEAPLRMDDDQPTKAQSRDGIVQRHRYEIPEDRMRQFATATGAWQDSGNMPEAFDTSLRNPTAGQSTTTTAGAMMEFLGGNIGTTLASFNPDTANNSRAAPPQAAFTAEELEWQFPEDGPEPDEALMAELDELIRATTSAMEPGASLTATAVAAAAAPTAVGEADKEIMDEGWAQQAPTEQLDTAMEDFDFDDIIFDGVFDMPLDE